MLRRPLRAPALAIVAVAAVPWLAGCALENGLEPEPVPRPPPTIAVAPDPVLRAFRDDFPTAEITDFEHLRTETGALLYRFMFIRAGNAESATYFPDGRLLDRVR